MTRGLLFDGVSRSFGALTALEDLDLHCRSGVLTCLAGPNGAGKSTALALAAGLLRTSTGRILLHGAEVRPELPARSTGYLPQRSAFHPSLSVSEIVEFTLAARAADRDQRRRAFEVTGLEAVMHRLVRELSGGWVRRLGLFAALVGEPELLLLDEPFAGLDPETHDRLLSHLHTRVNRGATVLVASHDFEALDPLLPAVAVLEEGLLVESAAAGAGSSRAVYRRALAASGQLAPGKDAVDGPG